MKGPSLHQLHSKGLWYITLYASWALLAFSTIISKELAIKPSDLVSGLGIVSEFPLAYWAGFIMLMVIFCALMIGKDKDSLFYLYVLITQGCYLFGFKIAIQPVPFEAYTFLPYATTLSILKTGFFNLFGPLFIYSPLPGNQILNVFVIKLTGIGSNGPLEFMPFVWIVAFAVVIFAGCRRLGLTKKFSFLASFMTTAAWNFSLAGYDYPRLLSTLLLISLFVILLGAGTRRYQTKTTAVMLPLFVTIVITHQLTALVAFGAVVLVGLYLRKPIMALPFTAVFLVWYSYIGTGYFLTGFSDLLAGPLGLSNSATNILAGAGSQTVNIVRYSTLVDLFVFTSITLLLLIRILFMNPSRTERKLDLIALLLLVAAGLQAPIYSTTELPFRIMEFGVFPLSVALAYLVSKSRIGLIGVVLAIILLLMVLSPIINYGIDTYQYYSPEANGDQFYATHYLNAASYPFDVPYYYIYDDGIMFHYNPSFGGFDAGLFGYAVPLNYTGMNLTPVVIVSYMSTTMRGSPWNQWASTPIAQSENRIYDNTLYTVYLNRQIDPHWGIYSL